MLKAGIALAVTIAASPVLADGWEPIRNAETGLGAAVCSADFAECFGLRCLPGRGLEFFVMTAKGAGEETGALVLLVDGDPVAEKLYVRAGEFGDLVTPYRGGDDATLIGALRSGEVLRVDLPEAAFNFSLTGSGKAIDETLAACQ